MIVPGSRYTDHPLAVIQVNKVTRQVINANATVPVLLTYWWYQTTDADTPSSLATRYLGDPTKWWQIADANPEILDWSDVPSATVIRIPVIA